jgi:hypothetical protein
MIDVQEKRNKIIEFLESSGPSLPVRVAKSIEMDPMITSAIASELISSKKIKTSNMKIGASPLYLIPGQEEQLEKFSDNLKSVEKEAYHKLKEKKILIDEDEEPPIRVALRKIKDFAIPFKFQEKIMWKYSFVPEDEIQKLLYKSADISKQEKPKIKIEIKPEPKIEEKKIETNFEEINNEEKLNEEVIETSEIQKSEPIFQDTEEEIPKAWETKKEEIKKAREESIEKKNKKIENIFTTDDEEPEPKFLQEIKKFLEKENIEFLEEIRTEKKEVMATVKISSQLGDITFTMIAKDKKTTNKDEIIAAVRMAKNSNTPCLLIIRKEPSKSVQKIIDENHLMKLKVME